MELKPVNPKITFAAIKIQDAYNTQNELMDPDYVFITKYRDQVLEKYQRIFSPRHIPQLSKNEFLEFLLFRNNHHWTNLNRVGKFMVEDMSLLREALLILIDENISIEERINQLRPERHWAQNSMVSHLGTPVLTAILLINFPEKYGVWNNTSEAGLQSVRLWDKRWETQSTGATFAEINAIFNQICSMAQIDLWTLDALWWMMTRK